MTTRAVKTQPVGKRQTEFSDTSGINEKIRSKTQQVNPVTTPQAATRLVLLRLLATHLHAAVVVILACLPVTSQLSKQPLPLFQ